MTKTILKSHVYIGTILLLAVVCPGCIKTHSYLKRQFIVEAIRPTAPLAQSRDMTLMVRSFAVDPVCESRTLLYRKGESEYESDFYNEFLVAPQVLISSQTRKWLSQSGMFKTVLEPGGLVEPTHVLEGNVLALHGDLRGEGSHQAVMEVRFFLLANTRPGPDVVFTQDYKVSSQLEGDTPDALVAAFEQCLQQILTVLEQDLAEAL